MNYVRNIFTHYKTSLAGAALAIGQVVLNGRSKYQLLLAIATAIVGAVAKDPGAKP